MIRAISLAIAASLLAILFAVPSASGAEAPCTLEPRAKCFGIASLEAALSTTQAGDHPDLTFTFDIKQDPESPTNAFGLHDAYAPVRNVRIELPPGLIGNPNVLGFPQQCSLSELNLETGCPNGSQIGITEVLAFETSDTLLEPIYIMQPPGGDVVARAAFFAGLSPVFIDFKVRSEGDYGLTAEINDAPTVAKLIKAKSTTWGVPADPSHDTERCTPGGALNGCKVSKERPPGSRPLAFTTNPTRCGVPLEMRVSASSWAEPHRFDVQSASFPEITGCNRLPFGPGLTIEPTNHRAGAPTGLDITARLPASDGVKVLEPAQVRDIKVTLPKGVVVNSNSADGLQACSEQAVHLGERVAAECSDAAKLAEFEADIPALPRRLKGAVYLRTPEPGNLFRFWAVADDLGAHVKLQGQLNVDKQTGQIESVLLDTPQTPLREVKLVFKSGFRAPLVNPQRCGTYASSYEFVPWSGGPPLRAISPIEINSGCDFGAFQPKLSAGTVDPAAGQHSPFVFTLTREDGEQNPAALDVTLPKGLVATFAGIPRCDGAAATTGACPASSRIGKVAAALGSGTLPLWVPQPGKRPTAVYLGGPYKGAPLSVIAVVPAEAGPFDLGDEVVRSAIYVDPDTAQGTVESDPLPQFKEGVPLLFRTINVELDRPDFTLNPTGCNQRPITGTVTSSEGAVTHPSAPFHASNCGKLAFKPQISLKLFGGTRRGSHPRLEAVVRPRPGDSNFGSASVALPHSAFLDQAHIRTVCTRVQFAADQCPAGSIYGHATATTPLIDEKLEGNVYLRSSSHQLPDLVVALHGPPSLPIRANLVGRIDSINGGIRSTFDTVPDVPVGQFVLKMQGGKQGLLVNSTNICASVNRATASLVAQNGRKVTLHPALKPSSCG